MTTKVTALVISAFALTASLFGQAPPAQPVPAEKVVTKDVAPPMRPGNIEAGGFIGGSYGIDNWRVMGGGNVSYALTRIFVPYAEVSYFPGIDRQLSTPLGKADFSVPITDVHGGVHIRFPIGQSRIVPYAAAGAGVIHSGNAPVKVIFPDGTTLNDTVSGSSNFAVNFGGGLRFYTQQGSGMRFEAKVYKPTGVYTAPFYKVEVEFFFRLR